MARSRFGDGAMWQDVIIRRPLASAREGGQSPVGSADRRRESEAGLLQGRDQAKPPTAEKDGRASGRRWNGALRGVPVRKGSAARSRREGKAFPFLEFEGTSPQQQEYVNVDFCGDNS